MAESIYPSSWSLCQMVQHHTESQCQRLNTLCSSISCQDTVMHTASLAYHIEDPARAIPHGDNAVTAVCTSQMCRHRQKHYCRSQAECEDLSRRQAQDNDGLLLQQKAV